MMYTRIRYCLVLAALLFPTYVTCLCAETPAHIDYVLDTDIGGDIDDVLALLLAIHSNNKPIAITTSHIAPAEKAKIAKLILSETGYGNIPVYAGEGVEYDMPKEAFIKMNVLWPLFLVTRILSPEKKSGSSIRP